ncbi:MAG: site-specific DNA-methyltransferase [Actinomycetota bacterium]|nr:site-specific DNA-methyltransferase [Acidimicrobiia bacterium]MDQ3293428.1 site-specific DNA-methyltransferase [Actinomycetota bacterium]
MRDPLKKGTSTSNFGVGKREAHDSTAFYDRFEAPRLSDDDTVLEPFDIREPCILGDIRERDDIPDGSVALVVTSPPYFAGKQYEEELGSEGVPASYKEYLELLYTVFDACAQKLEPGGRIAVNVANLGRKPYRSLSADVIQILQDRLGLLLRGEIIWKKGDGAGGNCAWGSFKSPANPVLRDITERVVVASKGRFDRAKSVKDRERLGLPHRKALWADAFMHRTLDVWDIAPESAKRVGHPAPFPVELPEWLIGLYTYEDDLVLDPFLGSGSSIVAAHRLGRRGIGYDIDPDYVSIAKERLADEVGRSPEGESFSPDVRPSLLLPSAAEPTDEAEGFQARATREGKAAQALAEHLLEATGFTVTGRNVRVPATGAVVNFEATGRDGRKRWWFDVSGAFASSRGGLLRTDTVWKALGRASVLRGSDKRAPLILLSSHLPRRGGEGDRAIRATRAAGETVFDVVGMLDTEGFRRLLAYSSGVHAPLAGYWTDRELAG